MTGVCEICGTAGPVQVDTVTKGKLCARCIELCACFDYDPARMMRAYEYATTGRVLDPADLEGAPGA